MRTLSGRGRLRDGALAIALGLAVIAPASALALPTIPAGAHFTSWADNGKDGERILQVVRGDLPEGAGVVAGVVKTDTNCDEDADDINHCHNVIALGSGGEIEVVLNHRNTRTLCLSPGDKLTLTRMGGGWLAAKKD